MHLLYDAHDTPVHANHALHRCQPGFRYTHAKQSSRGVQTKRRLGEFETDRR